MLFHFAATIFLTISNAGIMLFKHEIDTKTLFITAVALQTQTLPSQKIKNIKHVIS